MSKKLNIQPAQSKEKQETKSGLATDAKQKPWTLAQYQKDYEEKLKGVLTGLDAGKNKEMDKKFCMNVMEASIAGKQLAQKSGKVVNVPDISFDDGGVMQVDMVSYDPKEDVPQRQTGKRLDAKPAKEQEGYDDVAKDLLRNNPVSSLVRSAKSLSKGDVGDAMKHAVQGVPFVSTAMAAKQAYGVHQDRVKAAEDLQKRVMGAAGLSDQKDAGMEF